MQETNSDDEKNEKNLSKDEYKSEKDNLNSDIRNSDDFLLQLQLMQQSFGNIMGIIPGAEMLQAIKSAKQMSIQIHFIDRPFRETIERLQEGNSNISKEQNSLVDEYSEGEIPSSQEELIDIIQDFESLDVLKEAIQIFEENFPFLARIFLKERNEYMIEKIQRYRKNNPSKTILILVGGAHIEAIIDAFN